MEKIRGKKMLVIGYTIGNLGDDLFFKILFERFPNHIFYLLAKNEYKAVFKHDNLIIIDNSLLYRFLWKYKSSLLFKILAIKLHGCIIIGGSIFMENENSEQVFNYQNLIVNSFFRLKKKVFILGSNFGPFKSERFFNNYKKFFSKIEDVCFRDFTSYGFFSDLNNVRYAPDVVFSMKSLTPINEKKRQVGFSLINIENRQGLSQYHHSYISKIAELIQEFVQENYDVKLFSFCEREGDLQAITEVINMEPKNKNKVKVINYHGDIETTLKELQCCQIIVGTRFHSIILGLFYGNKVLPIYYSEKMFNYINDLDAGNVGYWIKDIEKLTFKKIVESGTLSVNKLHVREADQQFKILAQFLDKK